MLHYDKINFITTLFSHLHNLFNLRCLVFALISSGFSYIIVALNEEVDGFNLQKHSASINMTLSVFNFFLATTISFRINNAYNSWSNGFNMTCKLVNLCKRFLNISYNSTQKNVTFTNLNTAVLHYIAFTFHMCRGNNGRIDYDGLRSSFISTEMEDRMGLINAKYQRFLNQEVSKDILEMNVPNDTIMMYIEHDIRKLIDELDFTDVGKTALNGLVNDIVDTSQRLYGIANIPVVHIYNQFINVCIVSYLIIFTLSMVTVSGWYTGIWVFVWSSIIFLANEVANQIDTPFGCEQNDIELEIILNNYKNQFNLFLNDTLN